MQLPRRTALLAGLSGAALPRSLRAAGAPFAALAPGQAAAIEAACEALAPGARSAGVAHYIDRQLAAPPDDALLFVRYLDMPPPWLPFYAGAAAALDSLAQDRAGCSFGALPASAASALMGEAVGGVGWRGPPSPLVAFVLRNDAVDVVWGTPDGFDALGVPYMPHIPPPRPW